MPLTDHIYDQRLHLRRYPPAPKPAPLHHFRIRLSSRITHDVMAATEVDARKHVARFAGRAQIVETIQMTGKA